MSDDFVPMSQIPPAIREWFNSLAAKRDRHQSPREMLAKLDSMSMTTPKSPPKPAPTIAARPAPAAIQADSAELIAANARLAALQQEVSNMQKRLPADVPADQKQHFTAAQARWEQIAAAFGDAQVRRPLTGESLPDYNRSLAGSYKSHSKAWKEINLYEVPDEVLDIVINQVHADALEAAKSPPVTPGVLTMRQHRDDAGRRFNRFYGDIGVMLDLSRNPRQYVTGFPALAGR